MCDLGDVKREIAIDTKIFPDQEEPEPEKAPEPDEEPDEVTC
jgi:hypothetical protein